MHEEVMFFNESVTPLMAKHLINKNPSPKCNKNFTAAFKCFTHSLIMYIVKQLPTWIEGGVKEA